MKVSLVEGDSCATLAISSSARALLRPLKKMCAGLCDARNDIVDAPRPAVPGKVSGSPNQPQNATYHQ
jgi:UDP-N-acetylglucosamine 2-epimerase